MASNPNMDALLKWSMQQQSDDPSAPSPAQLAEAIKSGQRPDLDPAVLEAMMGKSEATMMQEELRAAVDESRTEEDREVALDNFEMLIESIDNANLITSMKMWSPLLSLLSSTSGSPRLQVAALWILGTACQNNPSAQDALLHAHSTPEGSQGLQALDLIMSTLAESMDMAVRAKAIYALSALLGHHPRAVKAFGEKGGFQALKAALRDPSINIRRKTAFLVNSLLLQDDSASQAAAAQPLLLGAPPATTASSTAATASAAAPISSSASRATGVTLPAGSTPDRPVSNSAPMEKPPVTSTAASGVIHPSVPAALISSNLLVTLTYSLLPTEFAATASANDTTSTTSASSTSTSTATGRAQEEDADAVVPELGLDGDGQEARTDEDYAEKALRALITFTAKYEEEDDDLKSKVSLGNVVKRGLVEVRRQMGNPTSLQGDAQIQEVKSRDEEEVAMSDAAVHWDWKKLNIEEEDWRQFEEAVERIAGK